jgi:hypothetical protein
MIKETNATKEYLKAITGKFDLESIFVLNLKEKNLAKLNAVILCINLTVLNLSCNKLNSVSGIGALKDLQFLDLSYNQITNIDDLEYLTSLKNLKLQGNKIDMPRNFGQRFKNLVCLEKMAFQEFDMNRKSLNPICKTQNYRNEMFSVFVNLKSLDFVRKESESLIEFFKDKEKENLMEMFEVKKINSNEFKFNFTESKTMNIKIYLYNF